MTTNGYVDEPNGLTGNWIKVSREIFDHELADDRPWDRSLAWIYLIGMASFTKRTVKFRGHKYIVERGQLIISQGELEKKTGWSRGKVRSFFDYLKRNDMITLAGTPLCTIATITDYNKWQGTNGLSDKGHHGEEHEVSNKRISPQRQELHTMPYEEYLRTKEWIRTRNKKLKQAKYECQVCGSTDRLDVHHRTYERRGYEDMSDLIVLCHQCHAKFHGKLP